MERVKKIVVFIKMLRRNVWHSPHPSMLRENWDDAMTFIRLSDKDAIEKHFRTFFRSH